MSKKLVIDPKIELWFPAFDKAFNGEQPTCPHCGSKDISVSAYRYPDDVGWMVITCNECNKSGYFSRVFFKGFRGKAIDCSE